jgi:hypothetical protein
LPAYFAVERRVSRVGGGSDFDGAGLHVMDTGDAR